MQVPKPAGPSHGYRTSTFIWVADQICGRDQDSCDIGGKAEGYCHVLAIRLSAQRLMEVVAQGEAATLVVGTLVVVEVRRSRNGCATSAGEE